MRNSHRKASLHGLYKGFLIFLASITTIWDNTAKKQRSRMMSHSCHLAFFVILLLEPFLQGPANCGLKVHSSSLVHLLLFWFLHNLSTFFHYSWFSIRRGRRSRNFRFFLTLHSGLQGCYAEPAWKWGIRVIRDSHFIGFPPPLEPPARFPPPALFAACKLTLSSASEASSFLSQILGKEVNAAVSSIFLGPSSYQQSTHLYACVEMSFPGDQPLSWILHAFMAH